MKYNYIIIYNYSINNLPILFLLIILQCLNVLYVSIWHMHFEFKTNTFACNIIIVIKIFMYLMYINI